MSKPLLIEALLNSNPEIKVGVQEFLVCQKELNTDIDPFKLQEYSKFDFLQHYNKATLEHFFYSQNTFLKANSFDDISLFKKENFQELNSDSFDSYVGQIWEKSTSGTSGKPLRVYFDTLYHLSLKFTSLYKLCNKLNLFDIKETTNKVVTLGITDNFMHEMICDICPFTKTNFFIQRKIDVNDPKSIQKSIDFILLYKPLLVRSKPYLLKLLANHLSENDIKLGYKPTFISSGCEIDRGTWEQCESVFDSKLINLYGCTEIGIIAYQRSIDENFELLEKDLLVEVLTNEGKPAPLNGEGNIVISSLRNKLFPIFRYQIGDLGIHTSPNSNFPKLKGRNLPLFVGHSGELIPSNQIANLLSQASIFDFKVAQNKQGELDIFLIDKKILNDEVKYKLEKELNVSVNSLSSYSSSDLESRFNSYI